MGEMTAKERANKIVGEYCPHNSTRVAKPLCQQCLATEFDAAIAAERKACAKVVEDKASEYEKWEDGSALRIVARAIRARGDGDG